MSGFLPLPVSFSRPRAIDSATKAPITDRILGKVEGQTGLRCMNGGNVASIVKNAAYPYAKQIIRMINAIQRSNAIVAPPNFNKKTAGKDRSLPAVKFRTYRKPNSRIRSPISFSWPSRKVRKSSPELWIFTQPFVARTASHSGVSYITSSAA